VAADRSKRGFTAALDELPDGVFVTAAELAQRPYLVLGDRLLQWSAGGYREARPRPHGTEVLVLTPKSTAETIRAGYAPEIHPSAGLT
jgi:hypothetical protein